MKRGDKMPKYKIIHNRKTCIGCGVCASLCPSNWRLEGEKARPIKVELDDLACNQEAASHCPTGSIKIIKIK